MEVKTVKRLAKRVDITCTRCGHRDRAIERTVWRCPECGQANAVLSAYPVEHEPDHKPKEKPIRREGFEEEAQEMLKSLKP
jgi:tRNA(Ile2) C34 agmatinyltransferase TiaS